MLDTERDKLLRELETWKQDLLPLQNQWDLFWSRWELLAPSDEDNPYISRFSAPYPFSHVETILPRIIGVDPTITYMAIDNEEDDIPAQMLSAVVNWQMQQMRWEWEMRTFLRQSLITGYSVAKIGWSRESKMLTQSVVRDTYHEELMAMVPTRSDEKLEIVLRNEAFVETVDVYDFVWPIRATSLNKAPAVWQRTYVSMKHIEDMVKKGFYTNTKDVKPYDTSDRQKSLAQRFAAQGIHPSDEFAGDEEFGEVELWERWEDDRLTVFANREHVVRDDPNPFWHKRKPYMDYAPVERPFSMHGVGVPKMLWDMNEDLSALKRQRRDAVTYTLNPMWKATEGVRESDINLRPGGVWRVPDTEDVEPATVPQVDFSASYQEEQNAKNDMQQITGAFDYLSGLNPGGVQTATGVATITSEGNKRLTEMIKVFAERAVKAFGFQMASLCVQYLDNEVAVPIYQYPEAAAAWEELKKEGAPRIVRIGRDDINTAGRVLPMPQVGQDKAASDVQKRSDATQALQAITPILASPQPVIDAKALADWALKQFGVDRHDRAKILAPPPQQVPMPAPTTPPTSNGVVGAPGVSGPVGPPIGESSG